MIHCVTTMNKGYYDWIGRVMIETWKEFFPNNYVLHLYLEDFELKEKDPRIIIEDWNDVMYYFNQWDQKRGSSSDRHRKFTKKAMSQVALWNKIKTGKMFWLDADCVFIAPVPSDLFDRTLGDYALASWGRTHFESGTVFINLDHPDFQKIKTLYEDVYFGDRGLPEGERWFDGEILGWSSANSGARYLDLTPLARGKGNTPLNQSWIGKYIQHFKAKRKDRLKESLMAYNRPDLAALL